NLKSRDKKPGASGFRVQFDQSGLNGLCLPAECWAGAAPQETGSYHTLNSPSP
ncbi:unnamed protein product, partial [Pleuronectes platessa]